MTLVQKNILKHILHRIYPCIFSCIFLKTFFNFHLKFINRNSWRNISFCKLRELQKICIFAFRQWTLICVYIFWLRLYLCDPLFFHFYVCTYVCISVYIKNSENRPVFFHTHNGTHTWYSYRFDILQGVQFSRFSNVLKSFL